MRNATKASSSFIMVLPLVVVWLIPIVVVAIIIPMLGERETDALAPPLPSTVEVGSRTDDFRIAVDVNVNRGDPEVLLAPASGVVTAVYAQPGTAVQSGVPLVDIDGVRVTAFKEASPLFRDLAIGDSGADVEQLATFLVHLEYLAPEKVSTKFSWPIEAAVEEFQDQIGADDDGVFKLRYVSFVPMQLTTIAEISASVGSPVSSGSPFAEGNPSVTAITFSPLTEDSRALDRLQDSPVIFTAAGFSLELPSSDPPEESLGEVALSFSNAAAKADLSISEGADGSLKYSGGTLALLDGVVRGAVPSSAVVVASSGRSCVFSALPAAAKSDSIANAESVPLESSQSATGEIGVTTTDSTLIGATIIRDVTNLPREILQQCE